MTLKKNFKSLKNKILRKKPQTSYPQVELNNREENANRKFAKNVYSTTKYTPWNFIFKNLFAQFRRFTNFFFLLVVIITLIPAVSPLQPYTSVLPLIFVLGVNMLREAYEDIKRNLADRKVNHRKYKVLEQGGKLVLKRSMNLKVGDLLYIEIDQTFPADLVVLKSGGEEGACFIETAQLDGETNLKRLEAVSETNVLEQDQLLSLKGRVSAEPPNKHFSFKGSILIEPSTETIPLTYKQLLMRGTQLRHTPWIIGVLVYAGKDTKLSKNQRNPPSKFSLLDKTLNKAVIFIFVFHLVLLFIAAILAGVFQNEEKWFLDYDKESWLVGLLTWFSYFVLLSYLIPQSMMVCLEIVKVGQGLFIGWDREMAMDPNDFENTGAHVKSADLNDELARVQYIFSDKTGTLTENRMEFSHCAINGITYNLDTLTNTIADNNEANHATALDFLLNLALNHTVVPAVNQKTGELEYNAQSPDEEALCKAARAAGVEFKVRTAHGLTVNVKGTDLSWELLDNLEFTSARARASVVVRDPQGRIKMYSKGADSIMLPRINHDTDQNILQATHEKLKAFSQEGLRTLVLGAKDIPEDTWQQFHLEYQRAASSLDDRDAEMEAVANPMEANLDLLGATAIEDKLQDQVPQTIDYLLRAGIRVWVITGDKQETAINIGYSCQLLNKHMRVLIVNADSSESCSEILKSHIRARDEHKEKLAMVINGATLKYALEEHADDFLELSKSCHSVVCCRVTPLQKAEVVKLIKDRTKSICLAIGDGANDVAMIQASHIGVGIYGKEGTQAARASDFALRQFKHLKRLVCIHGRYSLIRNAGLIQYFFYKNAAIFLSQLWFSIYNGWSAQTLFDSYILTFFNIYLTSLPPIFYALFERDIVEEVIEKNPETYRLIQTGYVFTLPSLSLWFLEAIFHSVVFFFGTYLVFYDDVGLLHGRSGGMWFFGNVVMLVGMFTILLRIALFTNFWNGIVHFGIWGSMAFYIITICVESFFLTGIPDMYWIFPVLFNQPAVWFWLFLCPVICLLPDFIHKHLQRQYWPYDWMILQEQYREGTLGSSLLAAPDPATQRTESFGEPSQVALQPIRTDLEGGTGTEMTQFSPHNHPRSNEDNTSSSSSSSSSSSASSSRSSSRSSSYSSSSRSSRSSRQAPAPVVVVGVPVAVKEAKALDGNQGTYRPPKVPGSGSFSFK